MSKLHTTQERLLESAAKVFAEKGFRGATVAEICERAEANVAAVNYHFGDKESLYEQVWQMLFRLSDEKYPLPDLNEVGADAWLRCYIGSRLRHIFAPDLAGKLMLLIQHEMADPCAISSRLVQDNLHPRQLEVARAIKAYLGAKARPQQVQCAMINFTSLYVFMNIRTRGEGSADPWVLSLPEQQEVIEQTVEFTMAGLEQTRKMVEKNPRLI